MAFYVRFSLFLLGEAKVHPDRAVADSSYPGTGSAPIANLERPPVVEFHVRSREAIPLAERFARSEPSLAEKRLLSLSHIPERRSIVDSVRRISICPEDLKGRFYLHFRLLFLASV